MADAKSSGMSSGRRTVTKTPMNEETPLQSLGSELTPVSSFYVRNHFPIPQADASTWRLNLEGRLRHKAAFSLSELMAGPSKTVRVTMECAGNGRESLAPAISGTPWGLGAVSTGSYTGLPLRELLMQAGPLEGASQVIFTGADRGQVEGGREVPYARSLTLEQALDQDILVAWALNGKPLSPEHGYPLRLVVPAWYGMASVKWLDRIELRASPWHGFFQHEHYVFWEDGEAADGDPVTSKSVRSLIVNPEPGSILAAGPQEITGLAWSGEAPVVRVEVSVDGGHAWWDAELSPDSSPYAATGWKFGWNAGKPGKYTLISRATDGLGNRQPLAQRWNRLGYANNQVQVLEVAVELRP